MLRKLMLSLALLAAIGFAAAQAIVISPTQDTTSPDQIAKGSDTAAVNQTVRLILPKATALHLDASTITFDLRALDGKGWDDRARDGTQPDGFNLACVYVNGADVPSGESTIPGGIMYAVGDRVDGNGPDWNQIHLIDIYGNPIPQEQRVVNYPPLRLNESGELVDGSKDYFVCYQTFVMQLFSNFDDWDLSVERNDKAGQGIEHLYIQANTCANFGGITGLYSVKNNDPARSLIPSNLVVGPTGDHVDTSGSQCENTNSSWLDVLGVLAVKINSDHYGVSKANLTYTLMSADLPAAP